MRLSAAAVLYFAMVFGAGFLLGPIRVFWLEPQLGKLLAVICETPFLLAVMILAARWVPSTTGISTDHGSLATMGLGALVLQQIADFAVGAVLRGLTPTEQLQNLRTPAGMIYASLLLLFAAMPLLANSGRQRQP